MQDQLEVAVNAARRAGNGLVEAQGRLLGTQPEFKGRRTELVTAADREAEHTVVSELQVAFPNHAILAEEGVLTPEGKASSDSRELWIVDPLDGTTNFVHGLPFFAVSICLAIDGEPSVAVVHAPVLEWTFTATRGQGAFRNGEPMTVSATGDVGDALLATGFSYARSEFGRDDNVARLARALHACRDLRRFGSAALDLCMTGTGQFDGFWELYLQPYDVAAGALVVLEAGGRISDLDGKDDWLYGGQILASNGALHEPLLAIVGNGVT